MHTDSLDRLIRMANDIANNSQHAQDAEVAGAAVADHLRRFWPRAMRTEILGYLDTGGEALLPVARRAVELLQTDAAAEGAAP